MALVLMRGGPRVEGPRGVWMGGAQEIRDCLSAVHAAGLVPLEPDYANFCNAIAENGVARGWGMFSAVEAVKQAQQYCEPLTVNVYHALLRVCSSNRRSDIAQVSITN